MGGSRPPISGAAGVYLTDSSAGSGRPDVRSQTMPLFVLAYRHPIGYTPTAESTAAWRAWFAGMGDQLADLGKPVVGGRAVLGDCGPGRTELSGYSLINVPDLDAAVAIAKECPLLDSSGGIEVGQLGEVPGAGTGSPQAG
jgi:YCII-related domain